MNAKLVAEYLDGRLLNAEPVTVTPVETIEAPPFEEGQENSTLGLVELLLKEPDRVDRLNRQKTTDPLPLMTRFLCIAEASYLLFGLAMIVILNMAPEKALPHR